MSQLLCETRDFPLSLAQREIWFDQAMHPLSTRYNTGARVRLEGPLDVEAFRIALAHVVATNDSLRTRFVILPDAPLPLQRFDAGWDGELEFLDFTHAADPEAACLEWIDRASGNLLDVRTGPLFRFALLKAGPELHHWFAQVHHIICDGWGTYLLFERVGEAYTSLRNTGKLPETNYPQFQDGIADDLSYEHTHAWKEAEAYWAALLPEPPEALFAPAKPETGTPDGRESRSALASIDWERYADLAILCQAQGCSVFHAFAGLLYAWFSRTRRQPAMVLGLPVLNRSNARSKATLGLYTGFVPLPLEFSLDTPFTEVMEGIKGRMRQMLRHQRLPVSRINRLAQVDTAQGGQLFEVSLSFERYDYRHGYKGLVAQPVALRSWHEARPLTLHVQEEKEGDDILLCLDHRLDTFTTPQAADWLNRLGKMMDAVVANPTIPIGKLPLVHAEEARRLAAFAGDPGDPDRSRHTFDALFREKAATAPDALAWLTPQARHSYKSLEAQVLRVASALHATGHLPPGSPVALLMRRSASMVPALWGCILAGAAFVPIDPDYPAERIAFILQDSGAVRLLGDPDLLHHAQGQEGCIPVDILQALGHPIADNWPRPTPDDYLYTMYTSGSTGQPKGVRVRHRNLTEQLACMRHPEGFGLREDDRFFALTTYTFDPSLLELVLAPLCGIPIAFADEAIAYTPAGIAKAVMEMGATVLQLTPTRLRMLVEDQGIGFLNGIKTLLVGGEPFPAEMLGTLAPLHGLEIRNIYGPTETTVWSTMRVLRRGVPITLGRPMPQTELLLLDGGLELLPIGSLGEICISGIGITDGYLNRPELTAAHFVAHPFRPGATLYRTGDLGEWLEDGQLRFWGRKDDQVKIKGRRIEPGEVRAALIAATGATQAVVMAVQAQAGTHFLAGWYSGCPPLPPEEVQARLEAKLPAYMVPSALLHLERFPLLPNGKINKRALPRPQLEGTATEIQPEGAAEAALAMAWGAILGAEHLGGESDFFRLGGDSISAVRLIAKLRDNGWELELRDLFAHPKLRDQATQLAPLKPAPVLEAGEAWPAPDWAAVAAEIGVGEGHIADAYPTSPMQAGMLFEALYGQASGMYVEQAVLTIGGQLDRVAFESAFAALVDAHPALRTVFVWESTGSPWQVVLTQQSKTVRWIDLTDNAEAVESFIAQDRLQSFALGADTQKRAPLVRVSVVKAGADDYRIVWAHHHILMDGWCMAILLRDLAALYTAAIRNTEPALAAPVPYKNYLRWLGHRDPARAEAWWGQYLDGLEADTALPIQRRDPQRGYRQENLRRPLGIQLTSALAEIGQAKGATLNHVLQALWAVLVARYTGREDLVLGVVVSGRPPELPGVGEMVGLFINTVPLRTKPSAHLSFVDLVAQMREGMLALAPYDHAPLARIQAAAGGRSLFDHIFVFENYPFGADTLETISREGELKVVSAQAEDQSSYGLEVVIFPGPDTVIELQFDANRYDARLVANLLDHYFHLAEQVAAQPGQALKQLSLQPLAQALNFQESLQPILDPAQAPCLHTELTRFAHTHPDATAIADGHRTLSYSELNAAANGIAATLLRYNLPAESRIAVYGPRSVEVMAAIFGILKAGHAFVPIDPAYPLARQQYLLGDANPAVVLWHGPTPPDFDGQVLAIAHIPATSIEILTSPDPSQAAYLIYTSGSTGKPKGTLVTHGNLANISMGWRESYSLGTFPLRILQVASLSFDVFVGDLSRNFYNGGYMRICPDEVRTDPEAFLDLLLSERITLFEATPALVLPTFELAWARGQEFPDLCMVIVGGEAPPVEAFRKFQIRYGQRFRIVNSYGLTETGIDNCFFEAAEEIPAAAQHIPIGKPFRNQRLYVLDPEGRPLPPGIVGDFYIGGDGVARGYHNRPALTADRFLPDPFHRGRIYRTGDRARWLPEGMLEFWGRTDTQVKLRGFRIELGEIEAALAEFPSIKGVVAHVVGERLLAWYLGEKADEAGLQAFMATRVPAHMVPTAFVHLESFPLTPNGKLDRKALPVPGQRAAKGVRKPVTAEEVALAEVFGELLPTQEIGLDSHFFALGGDSVKTILAVARMARRGWRLQVKDLFDRPILADLATLAVPLRAQEEAAVAGPTPLTPIQLWFWETPSAIPSHYVHTFFLRSDSPLDPRALNQSLGLLQHRHPALRMAYRRTAEGITQVCKEATPEVHFSSVAHDGAQPLHAWLATQSDALWDDPEWMEGPMLRALHVAAAQDWLVLSIHHLVVDAISWRIVLDELWEAYRAYAEGRTPDLPPAGPGPRAWADWLRNWANGSPIAYSIPYWKQVIQSWPSSPLPVPENRCASSHKVTLPGLAIPLGGPAHQAYNTQLNDLLLAALGLGLTRSLGGHRHGILLEGHGRVPMAGVPDIARTLGWFTAEYPFVLEAPEGDLRSLIVAVKDTLRCVPDMGLGYAALRYLSDRLGNEFPRPLVSFNFYGEIGQELSDTGLHLDDAPQAYLRDPEIALDSTLEFSGYMEGDEVVLELDCRSAAFGEMAAAACLEAFGDALREILAHCTSRPVPEPTPSDLGAPHMALAELDAIRARFALMGIEAVLPLTPMQEGMLFHALLDADSAAYFEQAVLDVEGAFYRPAYNLAFARLLARYPILRTAFIHRETRQPWQVVHTNRGIPVQWLDLADVPEADQAARIEEICAADRAKGFRLDRDTLMRAIVCDMGQDRYRIVWSHHHILMDGWCLAILIREFGVLYDAALRNVPANLPPIRPFGPFLDWLARQDFLAAEAYWRQHLAGLQAWPGLPLLRPDPQPGYRQEKFRLDLGPTLTAQIVSLAQALDLTPYYVLQGLWALLAAKLTELPEVMVGTVVAGRPPELEGVEEMVGLFINTLPLRIQVDPDGSFAECLQGIKRNMLSALPYAFFPLSRIQALAPTQAARASLFDHIFVFENYPYDEQGLGALSGGHFKIKAVHNNNQSHYGFEVIVLPGPTFVIEFCIDANRIDATKMEAALRQFQWIAEQVVGRPDQKLTFLGTGTSIHQRFWEHRLADLPEPLEIPADFVRPATKSAHHERLQIQWMEAVRAGLAAYGQDLFPTLMAALQVLLWRYTGQKDLLVGLLGPTGNPIPLRQHLNPDASFRAHAQATAQTLAAAHAHADYPFAQLVQDLGIPVDPARHSLFDIAIATHDAPVDVSAPFDLSFTLQNEQGVNLVYTPDLYRKETIQAIAASLETLVHAILRNPDAPLAELDLIGPEHKQWLLARNPSPHPFPHTTLPELVEAQVQANPHNPALVFHSSTLDYSTLWAQAGAVAVALTQAGMRPGDTIGLVARRQTGMGVTYLGIFRAGGTVLPIALDAPLERISYMLNDSGARLAVHVGRDEWAGELPVPSLRYEDMDLSAPEAQLSSETPAAQPIPRDPEAPAVLLYTSGSTGEPKGVRLPHRSVVRLICNVGLFQLHAHDRFLLQANYVFDVSLFDFFGALTQGATLYLLDDEAAVDPHAVATAIQQYGITHTAISTAMLNAVVESAPEMLRGLRRLYFGGERASVPHVQKALAQTGPGVLVNGYGPTEATVVTTGHLVNTPPSPQEALPIGLPFANARVYIVDEADCLVPPCAPGELLIGGDGLALGYLHPSTALENKFTEIILDGISLKVYRTGDRVRWRPDGLLDFLGRIDKQVKLRGYRIEVGEVEARMAGYPSLSAAAVLLRDTPTGPALVAFTVWDGTPDLHGLKTHVAAFLPAYMVPTHWPSLPALPLTPTGKVDRRALAAIPLEAQPSEESQVPLVGEVETALAAMWKGLLGHKQVGAHDDFFALGGHSLRVVQLAAKVYAEWGVELPLRDVYTHPVLRDLARHIQSMGTGEYIAIPAQPSAAHYPLSFNQARIWMAEQADLGTAVFNMAGAYRLRGYLDEDAFIKAIGTLMERHATLRTQFGVVDGQARQWVVPEAKYRFEWADLLDASDRLEAAASWIDREANLPIPLDGAPLFRIELLQVGSDDHVVYGVFHHIISDGWSMEVFFREWAALYMAYTQGRELNLPPLRIQYADYAVWQQEWMRGDREAAALQFWTRALRATLQPLHLPFDFPRPARKIFAGTSLDLRVEPALSAALLAQSDRLRQSPYVLLMAAWQSFLWHLSGQSAFTVGSPFAGRGYPGLEGQIGFYVHLLPMPVSIQNGMRFLDLADAVQRHLLEAQAHQEYPTERLLDHLPIQRDPSRSPLFDVGFTWQTSYEGGVALSEVEGLEITPFAFPVRTVKYDLWLYGMLEGDQVELQLEYNTDLFRRETINRFAALLLEWMHTVIDNPQTILAQETVTGTDGPEVEFAF